MIVLGDNLKLVCENELCIYQNKGKCELDYIELDTYGNCRECICIEVDENLSVKLKAEKERKLDAEQV